MSSNELVLSNLPARHADKKNNVKTRLRKACWAQTHHRSGVCLLGPSLVAGESNLDSLASDALSPNVAISKEKPPLLSMPSNAFKK